MVRSHLLFPLCSKLQSSERQGCHGGCCLCFGPNKKGKKLPAKNGGPGVVGQADRHRTTRAGNALRRHGSRSKTRRGEARDHWQARRPSELLGCLVIDPPPCSASSFPHGPAVIQADMAPQKLRLARVRAMHDPRTVAHSVRCPLSIRVLAARPSRPAPPG